MNYFSFLSLIEAILAFILGTLVLERDSNARSNRSFFFLAVFVGLSAFAEHEFRSAESVEFALFWMHFEAVWPLPVSLSLIFALEFTGRIPEAKRKWIYLLVLAPAIAFAGLFLVPNLLWTGAVQGILGWTLGTSETIINNLCLAWAFTFSIISQLVFGLEYRRAHDPIHRQHSKWFLYAFIFPTGIVILTNIILPLIGVNDPALFNVPYIVTIVFVGYAMEKFALFTLSKQKQADEKLRVSEEKYRLLFDGAMDPIFVNIILPDGLPGKIIEVNDSMCQRFGYSREELRAMTPIDLVDPEVRGHVQDIRDKILANHQVHFESVYVAREGTKFPAEINARLLELKGQLVLYSIVRDITEHKRVEELSKQYSARLENLVKLRTAELEARNKNLAEEITERQHAKAALAENERKFHTLADYTYDWAYWIAPDNQLIYTTPSCERITGYRPEEFSKDPGLISAIIHPEDRPLVKDHFEKTSEGDPFTIDFRIITRAGEVCWIAHACQDVYGDDGKWLGRRSSNREITERKRAEEELRLKEFVFNSSLTGDAIANNEGVLTHANQSYARMWGYDRVENVIGKHISDFLTDKSILKEIFDSLSKQGNWEGELAVQKKGGSTFFVYTKANVVRDANGKQIALYATQIDITARKNAEEKILEAKKAADAANRAKSDFLANMSHELRTPLNAIIGFSQILRDQTAGPLTPEQAEILGDILQSGQHLASVIGDILDVTQIEAGKLGLQISAFAIKNVLTYSMHVFKEQAEDQSIQLSLDVPEDIGSITADERRVTQVVINLLSNAIKFTPKGGQAGIIARRDGGNVQVTVWDTGTGIAPDNMDKLFRPFQRLATTLTDNIPGTGLGLNFSKKIVELHGGRMWVESELGKGSKFIFFMPIRTSK